MMELIHFTSQRNIHNILFRKRKREKERERESPALTFNIPHLEYAEFNRCHKLLPRGSFETIQRIYQPYSLQGPWYNL
jgi:hypothetical protein